MRLCVLLLVGCSTPASPRRTVPAPETPAPAAHIPHVQAPLGPSIVDEPEPAPQPEWVAPRPRRQDGTKRAPCFPDREVLVAVEMFRDLEPYIVYVGEPDIPVPPPGRYGNCTIANGELRDPRGTLVAQIHCGLTVYVPGIIDDLGFEVGARGSEVAKERDLPGSDALCWDEGDKHARCWFQQPDAETAHYGFAIEIDTRAGENGPLRDDDVRKIFATGTVARFTQRMYCH